MARDRMQPDLEADDELIPVLPESSRGGNEPPAEVNDRPEQTSLMTRLSKAGRYPPRNGSGQKEKALSRTECPGAPIKSLNVSDARHVDC